MPARTNDFQKLVKIINRHLAPVGAKITESAMLYDAEAETNREIDILVESTMLGCNMKIGIECSAAGAAMEIRPIEGLREKHRKVGVHQTVVVSKNGFTESAKKYAAKNHIKLLTFNAAKNENWGKTFSRLQNLSAYGRSYTLRSISLQGTSENLPRGFVFDLSVKVLQRSGEYMPLEEFVRNAVIAARPGEVAFKELMENENTGDDPWIKIGFDLKKEWEFVDSNGGIFLPDGIEVTLGYKSKYHALNAQQINYDGNELVVGGFFDKKNDDFMHVAINESNGAMSGTIEFSENFLPIRTKSESGS